MAFRRETEAARGGKGQRLRVACNLTNDAGEIAALEPFLQREQRVLGRVGCDMDHAVSEIGRQAAQERPSTQSDGLAILHPQHVACVFALSLPG